MYTWKNAAVYHGTTPTAVAAYSNTGTVTGITVTTFGHRTGLNFFTNGRVYAVAPVDSDLTGASLTNLLTYVDDLLP